MTFDRRRFLSLTLGAAAAYALPLPTFAQPIKPGKLKFVFLTDTHLQPELSADVGTAKAMRQIKGLRPDFCIQGGDHCFDLIGTPRERSVMLLDLYEKTAHALDGIPVHHTLGNHDVVGIGPASGVAASDPLYGKKAFEQRFNSRTYYSFDRSGYHFVVLDSIQILPNGSYDGRIEDEQLKWLAVDLAAIPAGTPVIVSVHIPLVTSVLQYHATAQPKPTGFIMANTFDVLPLFEGHNVIGVFQGHTHINETVYWRNTPYITSGAVCGNWWKGSRWGTPEGYTVVELDGGRMHWRYETYGWQSVKPEADALPVIAHPCTNAGGCV